MPGLTLMVLLGLMRGRSTGTRLLAFSWFSLKIWVMIWPLLVGTAPAETALLCSLASASGSTVYSPDDSTRAKPWVRSCTANRRKAWAGGTGIWLDSETVPLTRGSTTTLCPDKVAKVRATASMSALTKLSVTGSCRVALRAADLACGWAAVVAEFRAELGVWAGSVLGAWASALDRQTQLSARGCHRRVDGKG